MSGRAGPPGASIKTVGHPESAGLGIKWESNAHNCQKKRPTKDSRAESELNIGTGWHRIDGIERIRKPLVGAFESLLHKSNGSESAELRWRFGSLRREANLE